MFGRNTRDERQTTAYASSAVPLKSSHLDDEVETGKLVATRGPLKWTKNFRGRVCTSMCLSSS